MLDALGCNQLPISVVLCSTKHVSLWQGVHRLFSWNMAAAQYDTQ